MCNLILVDVGYGDKERTQIHRMDVITGYYLPPVYIDGTLVEQILKLVEVINKDRPDKIIFDRSGIGMGFYEFFTELIKQDPYKRCFTVDAFGLITHY